MHDYQTAGCAATDTVIRAGGTPSKDGVPSHRFYLADAAFLVGMEDGDRSLLEMIYAALRNPVWPLALGRRSYVPSEPIWIENGVKDVPLLSALENWPWIVTPRSWEEPPMKLLVSFESEDGSGVLKMDQPLSSFSERHFGARFVHSEWIPFPKEMPHVSE
jgi:CRISPR system Cascade subunit CasD